MKQAKFHLVFDRKNTTIKPEDQALIYIDCSKNGKRLYLSTGVKVQKRHFKGANNKWIDNSYPEAHKLNVYLTNFLNKFVSFDNQQMLLDIDYPLDALKGLINNKLVTNFIEYFEKCYLNNPKIVNNTKKYYNTTLQHLKNFGKIIYFTDLTYVNISGFDKHLHSLELKDTTISKYHKAMKSIVNEATRSGFLDKDLNLYKDIKTNAKAGERVYLTIDEVAQLENFVDKDENSYLTRSKDMFLMCVYTGLRYSDLIKLNDKTILFTKDKVEISLISQKTKKVFRITLNDFFKSEGQLNSKPVEIVLKYKDRLALNPFKISEQYYNRLLKDLAKASGINKNLTSHVARHTFGTYMASKVNSFTLKTLMQHSKIETTAIYVNTSNIDGVIKGIDWSK
ncbi:MAG: tyrosine-type recombinase/integrase [Bacteroidota bacterium]|nr:tyrosine-type recombinase/integrase [Bacteroidota bacterium]